MEIAAGWNGAPGSGALYKQAVEEAAAYLKDKLGMLRPQVGLVLGSGLGDLAEQIEDPIVISYGEVPHFPVSTVEGHAGQFVCGRLEGRQVIAMQGRFHYYEGYPMKRVVFPVYVMKAIGVGALVITNAAGGMNRDFRAGDLMLITDHINMTGANPLIGPNDSELGVRFPDMSQAYTPRLRELARQAAAQMKEADDTFRLQEGVYSGISGPAYMTPSELKFLALAGGDAVGMSTVGEVIAASHAGLEVLGLSCITDMAIGDELEPLTHEQVVAVANQTKPKFIQLVKLFLSRLDT
ncbi:purine-nucleoside phosphorylase [Xylanibacillus composti]|uniref:Purine nucleoside phosphorylase n=1 Tax=Xylanibacillus composti TaxID=1572762 RepID=A0A8J4H1Y0_9BACL|nr:purine-nucleoside phosphorylase [Xylanibacillus composti]MDT9726665.1 purine-nucleoside phosphorylase [Xylanibacillus composti]GIQ69404.1 purine nucleoside phosphorylase [Xylanibacillus composti]